MMAHEAIALNTSPYEDIHIELLMQNPVFKQLPDDVQNLANELLSIAQHRAVGIDARLAWPPHLLAVAARLQSGEKGNVRFLTPFAFLTHLEDFLIKEVKKSKQ
jgi:hypothetical protein